MVPDVVVHVVVVVCSSQLLSRDERGTRPRKGSIFRIAMTGEKKDTPKVVADATVTVVAFGWHSRLAIQMNKSLIVHSSASDVQNCCLIPWFETG